MTTKTISVKVDAGDSKRTIDILDSAMRNLGKGTNLTADEISQLTKAARGVKAGLGDVATGATKANAGMQGMGRSAGQVAVQLEQLFGQINSGGNITQALGFQLADIGIVMGAPLIGAIAGLTASFSGVLLPTLFNTTDELEEFKKQLEIVNATATLSVDGTVNFSNSLLTLSKISKEATRQLLLLTIEQNKIAQSKAGDALKQQFGDLGGFFSNFGRGGALAVDSIRSIGQAAGIAEGDLEKLARTTSELTNVAFERSNFGASFRNATQEVIELQTAIAEFEKSPNLTTISQVVDELEGIKVNGEFATDSARELAQQVFSLFSEIAKGEDLTNRLNEVLKTGDLSFKTLSGSAGEAKASLDEYRSVLERLNTAQQALALNNNEAVRTQQLQAEIAIRRQLAAGEIDQQTANEEIALQNLLFGYEARRAAILENEQFTAEQKTALLETLNNQEVFAQEALQLRLTQAAQSGADQRSRIAETEARQRKDLLINGLVAAFNITKNQNQKMTKEQKKQAKQSVYINTAAAIARAYGENNFYVASAMALFLAGMQLKQINAIDTASGGGSGSSVAAPTPAAQPQQQQQQSNTFEILGIDNLIDELRNSNGAFSGDVVANMFDSFREAGRNGVNTNLGG